ncbi:MAG: TRAP transporter fused permease subunit [Granulosicoccus sp.]|nr:TRAP transporter fused permease subunit [Granulosicoccus sp.]
MELAERKARLFSLDHAIEKPWPWMFGVIFISAFALWHIATNVWLNEPGRWQNAIHFAGFAFLAAITTRTFGSGKQPAWSVWANALFAVAIASSSLWIAFAENGIYERTLAQTGLPWQFGPIDWLAGFIVIVGVIELTRRLTGWIIPILVVASLAYILFLGKWMPGAFRAASLPLDDVLFRSLYNDEGMFGIITTISSSNITLFMIFGAFLVISGASEFVIEISKVVAGRFRGGAAFVAVISSALTGTISGSAIANTASTGVITIPLMKSNGFRGQFAAGVEAASSTGGQLMPPIMGAGAFIMASYTGIPYATIVAVSVVPALLYFLSVAFIVRIEAIKHQIGTEQVEAIDKKKMLAGLLNFVLPLGVMTYMLVSGRTPSYAASFAIATLIVVSWATPNKMGPKNLLRALTLGISTSVMTAILLVAVGLINNAVTTSGLANTFALMIAQWSQGSLLIALALVAIASLVLGMGLPVTAAYIVLSILSAPALAGMLADSVIVQQLVTGISDPSVTAMFMLVDPALPEKLAAGLSLEEAKQLMVTMPFDLSVAMRPLLVDPALMTTYLLTAHLIVFWLSQDSNVTPPVCLAAFTAAGIAGSKPMPTGVEAWKVAKGLYIVPLMFAYTPMIGAPLLDLLRIGGFALFGIYAFNVLLQRYSEGPLSWFHYPLLVIGAVGAFYPLHWWANIGGAALVLLVGWMSLWNARRGTESNTAVIQS